MKEKLTVKGMIEKYPQLEDVIGWVSEHDFEMFENLLDRSVTEKRIDPEVAADAVLEIYSRVLSDRNERQTKG